MKELRSQDKLGKRNLHEDMKNLYEPLTDTFNITSEDLTKTMILISNENNRILSRLNDKILEITNDRGIIASYLLSLLSKITNPDIQFNIH